MKKRVLVQNIEVRIEISSSDDDYISLTDIARYKDAERTNYIIQNWMRNRSTIEFLGLWEKLNNRNFNSIEFDAFRHESGLNSFSLTPQRWTESTNAIGIVAKSGRYGGTYAHKDIAYEFASWISPEFKLYLIKEFQRLKSEESQRLALGWDVKRQLAKINYRIHTDAIKEHLIPPELPKNIESLTYANEADVLNVALFGMTAKMWREQNPHKDGNIRDYANITQLVIITNLEGINAELIREGLPQPERLVRLNQIAITQMKSLLQSPAMRGLEQKQ